MFATIIVRVSLISRSFLYPEIREINVSREFYAIKFHSYYKIQTLPFCLRHKLAAQSIPSK